VSTNVFVGNSSDKDTNKMTVIFQLRENIIFLISILTYTDTISYF